MYDAGLKRKWDNANVLAYAKEQDKTIGMTQGRKEGRAEGRK